MKTLKKSFTLVELIIVIAIIAILAVTAFLTLTKRLGKSRDSRRVSDLTAMDTALQVYVTEKSVLPRPDNAITINASGTAIGYQGIFGDTTKSTLGNITSKPIDPTDNLEYIYYIDVSQKNYQLLGFTEQTSSVLTTANAVDYSVRFIQTRGSKLGILLSGDNTPVNLISSVGTGLDIQNITGNYNAYFDNSNKLTGTGAILQWLYPNVNNGGNGFDAPSLCPTGFIPVPGNKDFNQPGFCVAKYEMKQINGTAGYQSVSGWMSGNQEICNPTTKICYGSTDHTLSTGALDGQIISKADGLPITSLNQATAIQSCKAMGAGYHLITNNEWTTVARNVEAQGQNRTGGVIGSGGIYRGKNYWSTTVSTAVNKDSTSLDCNMGTDINGVENTGSMVADANSTACKLTNGRNKRELFLSNGQTIWDLAGNVEDYVNKANTIDGTGFNNGQLAFSSVTTKACPRDGANTNCFELKTAIDGSNLNKSIIMPLNQNLDSNNGIGMGYSYAGANNNILFRGGFGYASSKAGIFTLSLDAGATYAGSLIGFRCAR